jgi:hypothetical protein
MQPMLLISLTEAVKPLRVELKHLLQKSAAKKPAGQTTAGQPRRAGKQSVTA